MFNSMETQNTVFAARVHAAVRKLPAGVKRGNGRMAPLSVLKSAAFAHSDWDVFECMIKSAARAGCLRTLTYKGIQWVVIEASVRVEASTAA